MRRCKHLRAVLSTIILHVTILSSLQSARAQYSASQPIVAAIESYSILDIGKSDVPSISVNERAWVQKVQRSRNYGPIFPELRFLMPLRRTRIQQPPLLIYDACGEQLRTCGARGLDQVHIGNPISIVGLCRKFLVYLKVGKRTVVSLGAPPPDDIACGTDRDHLNGLEDINSAVTATHTYAITDVGSRRVPHLTKTQFDWIETVKTSARYRRIVSDLRFYDPRAFAPSKYAFKIGVPVIVYDPCAWNWGYRRVCSIPRDQTLRFATYKIIGAKCSLIVTFVAFNYFDIGPGACNWHGRSRIDQIIYRSKVMHSRTARRTETVSALLYANGEA